MRARDISTDRMLNKIRSIKNEKRMLAEEGLGKAEPVERDNFYRRSLILMDEAVRSVKAINEEIVITKDANEFGDIKSAQEELVKKTIGEDVMFDDNSLIYHTKDDGGGFEDLVLEGRIPHMGLTFKFSYNDPSGDGVYIWAEQMNLSENNLRTIGKVRDAFSNWKDGITSDGEIMKRLSQFSEKKKHQA